MSSIFSDFLGKKVIVRTYSAGVHFGTLHACEQQAVVLLNARRIWYWDEAFTLNAVANSGIGTKSKVSEPVPRVGLLEAIEIIPCSSRSAKLITEFPSHDHKK